MKSPSRHQQLYILGVKDKKLQSKVTPVLVVVVPGVLELPDVVAHAPQFRAPSNAHMQRKLDKLQRQLDCH